MASAPFYKQAAAACASALSRFGRIDALVNNAGYGQISVNPATHLLRTRLCAAQH
ncbi:hypothetical protein [Bradyrhizobium altum]|uniref:hypothetical protein n=1 Tax=Bradyrhizobium altum TaxID=1571202 RepID=UPI001E4D427A|nr:hypothetical protein [Bradyrhizobium altum]